MTPHHRGWEWQERDDQEVDPVQPQERGVVVGDVLEDSVVADSELQDDQEAEGEDLQFLKELIAAGKVTPVIDRTLSPRATSAAIAGTAFAVTLAPLPLVGGHLRRHCILPDETLPRPNRTRRNNAIPAYLVGNLGPTPRQSRIGSGWRLSRISC